MKRRYLIAKAMVHYPKILILDEPTAGVDIELRDQLWSYIKKLHNDGVTIIITTHYLEEAEKLCDQIAFINDGKIIKQDSKENLLQSFEEKNIHIEFASPIDIKLLSFPGLVFEQISETKIFCRFNSNKHNFNELLKQIQNCGNIIKDIQMNQADLEYIFKKIIYN
jgi:ABC-2 type transport system ATP-binding protein